MTAHRRLQLPPSKQEVAGAFEGGASRRFTVRPKTSKPTPGHKVYPGLLPKRAVTRPNRVWLWTSATSRWRRASSISALSSIGSALVLSWRPSITMETAFWIEAVEGALARYGKPGSFNMDLNSLPSRSRRGTATTLDVARRYLPFDVFAT